MNIPRQRLAAACILALLPILLLWRVVFLGECFLPAALLRDIAPWSDGNPAHMVPWNPLMWDGIAEFYPWRLFAARTLHTGYIPLWNPHQFCGTPFVANSQSAVFYPLNLLFVLFSVPRAFGISVLVHLFLTGTFCYLFLRSTAIGRSHPAALLGAIAWQLSTWQVAWLALPTFLCVSTWLPLALLLTDRLVRQPTTARATLLGICLGLMLLAGHLQIALYCLFLIAGYGLFRIASAGRLTSPNPSLEKEGDQRGTSSGQEEGRRGTSPNPSSEQEGDRMEAPHRIGLLAPPPALRRGLGGGVVLVLFLMFALAAPQLLPTVELSRMSHRAGAHASWEGYHGYSALAMPAYHLATLVTPYFVGNPTLGTYWGETNYAENACSVGVLALLLALIAVAFTWRADKSTRFFAIAALLSLLVALGTWLAALPYFLIPGFSQTGSPARILVLWAFCAATLAARGADALFERATARAFGIGIGLLLTVAAGTMGYACWWVERQSPGALATNLGEVGDLWRVRCAVLLSAGLIVGAYVRKRVSQPAAIGVLAVIVAAEALANGLPYNRTSPLADVYPVTPAIAFLQKNAGRERIMPINKSWSIDPAHPPHAVLPPNAATVYGLYDTQGYDSLQTGQYMAFTGKLNGTGKAAPDENGNITFTNDPMSPLAPLTSTGFILSRDVLPSTSALVQVIVDGDTHVYQSVPGQSHAHTPAGGTVTDTDVSTPTRLHAKVRGGNDLAVADQWYPGWHAYVDGAEQPIEEAPEVFRTVHWSTSSSAEANVVMKYEPSVFRLGLYLLCAALTVIALVATRSLVIRTQIRPTVPSEPA
jgi:hypothetical protein